MVFVTKTLHNVIFTPQYYWRTESGGMLEDVSLWMVDVSLIAPDVSWITLEESVVVPVLLSLELPQAKRNKLIIIARQSVIHNL